MPAKNFNNRSRNIFFKIFFSLEKKFCSSLSSVLKFKNCKYFIYNFYNQTCINWKIEEITKNNKIWNPKFNVIPNRFFFFLLELGRFASKCCLFVCTDAKTKPSNAWIRLLNFIDKAFFLEMGGNGRQDENKFVYIWRVKASSLLQILYIFFSVAKNGTIREIWKIIKANRKASFGNFKLDWTPLLSFVTSRYGRKKQRSAEGRSE